MYKRQLLEDINLSGANGVLVNVTAGMDLSIGEFQEVGETVKQFAADDAEVILGTVIEPDMNEEIRVTIVATGLGKESNPKEIRVVSSSDKVVNENPNYNDLDIPTVRRNSEDVEEKLDQEDMLDIPAFLRRQAD